MELSTIIPMPRKRKSPPVTPEMAAKIKTLLDTGMCQHDIAAFFRINQGRISEINTGRKFPGVERVQLELVFA
ncbi:MAG: hypothetical protein EOS26_05860 [Mesorhizobium sp.]|nr:MAG: hypothetical protein EOS26_05860 [Mesorhizobium sp.]